MDWLNLMWLFVDASKCGIIVDGTCVGGSWDNEAERATTPVRWITVGTESGPQQPVKRVGRVLVTVHGKSLKILEQYIEDQWWLLTLRGSRIGYEWVELNPGLLDPDLCGFDPAEELNTRGIRVESLPCEVDSASARRVRYRVYRDNQSHWILLDSDGGSAGCSLSLTASVAPASNEPPTEFQCREKNGVGQGDPNKPLQPTRAAEPNGKREPPRCGPRG